jgi:SAM-dependent methyltransferase
VTDVDFARAATKKGRGRAVSAGVEVKFLVDDLNALRWVEGTFDLLVDYGTLDDLRPEDRDPYMQNILLLTQPGSRFLLYAFEWTRRWWEPLVLRLILFDHLVLEPGEAQRRFSEHLDVVRIGGQNNYARWPPACAVYLMTRKSSG